MEEPKTNTFKPISIREVFAEKNPRLAKLMPGFVYRYLKQILHIEFLNDFLKRNGHLKGIAFVDEAVKEFNVKEHIHGLENIPSSGRFIFASNHPLGGFDGMLLMKNVDKVLGELKFLSNDILMNIPNLSPMFVPVNKHGGHSRDVARVMNETYLSDQQILIFPSGLASRKIKGGLGFHLGLGLGLSFSYILFMQISTVFAISGATPPFVAVWIPNLLYSIIAFFVYRWAAR